MFGNNEGKPVDLEIVEHTYIDGKLVERGTKLKGVPAELAMELAAAGKARIASAAALSKKAEKAEA